MHAVLGTRVSIAALITSDTPPDLIYQAWRKKCFEPVTSEWQLDELRRVSCYPRLRKYLKPIEAGALVNGLRHQATVLKELPNMELSPDPDDNPILATAIPGGADYLVTGDKRDLLSLGKVEAVQIITAPRFADLLGVSPADRRLDRPSWGPPRPLHGTLIEGGKPHRASMPFSLLQTARRADHAQHETHEPQTQLPNADSGGAKRRALPRLWHGIRQCRR